MRLTFFAVAAVAASLTPAAAHAAELPVPDPGDQICVIAVERGDSDDCSQTYGDYISDVRADLQDGLVPEGFAALPAATRQSLKARRKAAPGGVSLCTSSSNPSTVIYDGYNHSGATGTMGYTGVNTYWRNFSTTWNNKVSSAVGSAWTTFLRDGTDGGAGKYDGLTPCRAIYDFRNAFWVDPATGVKTSSDVDNDATSWKIYS